MRMSLGLALPVVGADASPDAILRAAEGAERIGLDSVWVNERHLRPAASGPFPMPPSAAITYDPIETLAFVASRTSRVRLGTSVLLSVLHNPLLLARRLATLDALSRGRVIVGLGQPMLEQELVAAGVSPRRRGAGFQELIEAMRAVWGPDPVRFHGRFYEIPESDVGPKPVQPGGPPVLVAAIAPASVDRAGAMGLGLNPQLVRSGAPEATPEGVARSIARFRSAARAAGHDSGALPVMVRVTGPLTDRPLADRAPLTGSPEQVAEDLGGLERLGVDHVFWGTPEPIDPDQQLGLMERLLAATRAAGPRPSPAPGPQSGGA